MQLKVLKQWLFLFLCFVFFFYHMRQSILFLTVSSRRVGRRSEGGDEKPKVGGRRMVMADLWTLQSALPRRSEV